MKPWRRWSGATGRVISAIQNVIERAVITSKGTMLNVPLAGLEPDAIPKVSYTATNAAPAGHKSLQDILDQTERIEVLRALEASKGILIGTPHTSASNTEAAHSAGPHNPH